MTPDFLNLAILVAIALFASFFAAITGGGVTVILLPVLVFQFGIQAAMPIVTIALFAASASRVAAYGRQVDFRPVWWFSLGSLPFTLLGTYLFTVAEPDLLTRVLGAFLILAAAVRRLRSGHVTGFSPLWFLPLGMLYGLITGITAVVAVLLAPFFLWYGLRKGAFVGTMAVNILLIQIVKLAVFGGRDYLDPPVLIHGAVLVPCMMAGTFLGGKMMDRVSEAAFVLAIEVVMVLAGLIFLTYGAGT
ncbi:MAG: sulfite exporter TauE/SafE family protein [SAR324 cluster bacterium]|nr:sulfite exporter TauE/SafE family protein [SAR324 cluster bacterium]